MLFFNSKRKRLVSSVTPLLQMLLQRLEAMYDISPNQLQDDQYSLGFLFGYCVHTVTSFTSNNPLNQFSELLAINEILEKALGESAIQLVPLMRDGIEKKNPAFVFGLKAAALCVDAYSGNRLDDHPVVLEARKQGFLQRHSQKDLAGDLLELLFFNRFTPSKNAIKNMELLLQELSNQRE